MVLAKTELFKPDSKECARLFKALSHPARLEILKYLAELKTCVVGDISEVLPLSRTTVNQHLTALKNAGLIKGTISGNRIKYCINPVMVSDLIKLTETFFDIITTDGKIIC